MRNKTKIYLARGLGLDGKNPSEFAWEYEEPYICEIKLLLYSLSYNQSEVAVLINYTFKSNGVQTYQLYFLQVIIDKYALKSNMLEH